MQIKARLCFYFIKQVQLRFDLGWNRMAFFLHQEATIQITDAVALASIHPFQFASTLSNSVKIATTSSTPGHFAAN